ncbi:MAG: hypothetical protein IKH84_02725 [Ottowia sp.]|nr:hypothetical protein [Ottowia sp.]
MTTSTEQQPLPQGVAAVTPEDDSNDPYLMLTPEGVLYAFAEREPDETRAMLQTLLPRGAALRRSEWLAQGPGYQPLLVRAQHEGWVSEMAYEQKHEQHLQLDSYLTHAIAGLSGSRRAAIASDQGFCLAYAGYSEREAETISAAAVEFFDFAQRQRQRGFRGTGRAISFYEGIDMLMPTASLVLFFVDGIGYWLILGGEPLLNSRALVEVIWSIRLTGSRYTAQPS